MKARASGFTLIELVIAIVIISAVGTTVLALLARVSLTSSEMMSQSQRTAVAKAYLEEILSKSLTCADATSGRQNYDCVQDYAGISNEPVTDRFGNLVGFPGYSVSVVLSTSSALQISGLPAVPAAQRQRVEVRVTDAFGDRTSLIGIKTLHP
jgi:MSHA pilin protein MshD